MERLLKMIPTSTSRAAHLLESLAERQGCYRITMTQPAPLIFPMHPGVRKAATKHKLRGRVKMSLEIIKAVAAQDADYAARQNGVGFNKADSGKGHALARLSPEQIVNNPSMVADVLKLGRRYSGQAASLSQLTLF